MTAELKQGMAFGAAVESLKQGKKVARAGWNGKGMWLSYVSEESYAVAFSLAGLDISEDKDAPDLAPWIGMKTADNKFVPWLASQSDVLAEDWVLMK